MYSVLKRWTLRVAGALVLALVSVGAMATTELPNAPIRLIVPFSPGTGIDTIARTLGPKLAEKLGRPVIVENRVGASGNIGTEEVVRAAPNGSTLLVSVSTLAMDGSLYAHLGFDPVRDLTPIAQTSWGQLVLVANPKTDYKTAEDLIKAAQRAPGKINYGSPGVGTPHHLAMALFEAKAGVKLTHIPYRGTGPALADLLSGQIEVMFLPIHVALPYLKAGTLVALGIGSDQRHPLLPNVPTLAQAHAGDVNVAMWYGIFAPRGMAPDLVLRLNDVINGIVATPQVRHTFESLGMDPASSTPHAFKELVDKDAVRWAQLIKAQHITAQ